MASGFSLSDEGPSTAQNNRLHLKERNGKRVQHCKPSEAFSAAGGLFLEAKRSEAIYYFIVYDTPFAASV